jgi:hypothetical protein
VKSIAVIQKAHNADAGAATSILFSPDDRMFYSRGGQGQDNIKVWDMRNLRECLHVRFFVHWGT